MLWRWPLIAATRLGVRPTPAGVLSMGGAYMRPAATTALMYSNRHGASVTRRKRQSSCAAKAKQVRGNVAASGTAATVTQLNAATEKSGLGGFEEDEEDCTGEYVREGDWLLRDDISDPLGTSPMEVHPKEDADMTRVEATRGDVEADENESAPCRTPTAELLDEEGDEPAITTSAAVPDDAFESKHLVEAFPEYALEYTEDNTSPVQEVLVDDARVVRWLCLQCQSKWSCGVFVRCVLKQPCPFCAARKVSTVATRRPDLVALWDRTRNDPFVVPEEVSAESPKVAYWLCPTCSQSYSTRIKDRVVDKSSCPNCAILRMQASDALAHEESALMQEWHPLKNGDLRLDELHRSDPKTKVWWLCSHCGHDWEATLAARLTKRRRSKGNCPVCHGVGV